MSFDLYHFHMVLRQETMTPAERRQAEEQAARVAQGAGKLGRLWRAAIRPRRNS